MQTGKIIFINGTSSAGKSSIVKALQNLLPDPFLDMGIDRFLWMLPPRYFNRPLWDDVLGKASASGPTGRRLFSAMHHAIRAAAQQGCNILADHVLIEKAWADECAELFSDSHAYLIGVQCPLEIIEQRERDRKDRTLGQAKLQYPIIHQHVEYDLEVDSSLLSSEECAQRIIDRLSSPPTAFKKMKARLI